MVSRLRFHRERRGWSRATLAEILSTTSALVGQWEEGISIPSPLFQEKIRALFKLDDQIFDEVTPSTNTMQYEDRVFLLLPYTTPTLPAALSVSSQREQTVVLDPFLTLPFKGIDRLFGRASLFQQLKQQVSIYHRLALCGLPGVGKTALAIALAHDPEIRAQFCDGVLWAGLGLHPHIPGVFRRWGKLLGLTIEEEERDRQASLTQTLRAAMAERHMLFILDDVWQKDIIDTLQIGGPFCAYILTTRMTHIANYFTNGHAFQVSDLEEDDSIQLLTCFAPEILQNEGEIALSLVRAVGGHPLALTLMSKYLGSNAVMLQPRRLHTALTQLLNAEQRLRLQVPQISSEHASTFSADMDVSIRSVIAVSYFHLPEPAREALLSLSILPTKPARLTQSATFAVANVTSEVLALLCDAELLERYGNAHFMLHPLIADYVRALGPVPEASMRLINYGLRFIQIHCNDASALEHESSMLLVALDAAWAAEQWTELVQGCDLFVPFLFRWGWYTLAEQLLQRASLAITRNGSLHYRICVLEHLSNLAHLQGNYTQAQSLAHQGLALAHRVEDWEKIIALQTLLGGSTHELGNYAQAESHYQEGLSLARQHGNKQQISTLLKNLGVLAKKHGNYALAQTYYQEGLTLARELNHTDLISLLLMNLGVIATERGNYPLAQPFYEEGLILARQLGHRERICALLSNLGVLADAQGNYAQAEELLYEGLTLIRQLGHRERMSLLLLNLGAVSNRQGKDGEAKAFYEEGLTLARQLEHSERISLLLLNLGDLAMEQGQDELAQSYFQEGLTLARQLEHRKHISALLLHLGLLAAKQRKFLPAEIYLQEGMILARQLDHPQLICRHLAAWGELRLQQQQTEAAENAFQEMLDLAPSGDRSIVAHAQYGLAAVAASQGQLAKAQTLAHSSYTTFELLGHRQKKAVLTFLEKISEMQEHNRFQRKV